jgi:glutamine amidotransferase
VIGLPLERCMALLAPDQLMSVHLGLTAAYKRAFFELRTDGGMVEPMFPGALAALDALEAEGWQLGIATGKARRGLDAVPGMHDALFDTVRRKGRPFLGICVGMQLMATRGLEFGETQGFGWIPGDVVAIEPNDPTLKIPHMGWNTLDVLHPHPLLAGMPTGGDGLHAYFVHSYHLAATDPATVVACTGYGGPVTAMVARDNMAGTQFHPEKSQRLGLGLIANFLSWKP